MNRLDKGSMRAENLWREIPAFGAFNESKGLSPLTIKGYTKTLHQFRRWFSGEYEDGENVTARRIRGFLAHKRNQGLTSRSVQTYWGALRAFFTFLVLDEVIPKSLDPMRLVRPLRIKPPQIEPLTKTEMRSLLDSFGKDNLADQRNYMICLLMLDTGLRVGEVVRLKLEDVKEHRIRVNGKGGKTRYVYVGEKTRDALEDYVVSIRRWIGNGNGTLFPPIRSRAAEMNTCHLSTIMKKKMDEVGIPRRNSSCHRLRHTFAVNYLRNGGNVFSLQKLLGHSTLEMTKRYVLLSQEDLQRDHAKASPVDRMEL